MKQPQKKKPKEKENNLGLFNSNLCGRRALHEGVGVAVVAGAGAETAAAADRRRVPKLPAHPPSAVGFLFGSVRCDQSEARTGVLPGGRDRLLLFCFDDRAMCSLSGRIHGVLGRRHGRVLDNDLSEQVVGVFLLFFSIDKSVSWFVGWFSLCCFCHQSGLGVDVQPDGRAARRRVVRSGHRDPQTDVRIGQPPARLQPLGGRPRLRVKKKAKKKKPTNQDNAADQWEPRTSVLQGGRRGDAADQWEPRTSVLQGGRRGNAADQWETPTSVLQGGRVLCHGRDQSPSEFGRPFLLLLLLLLLLAVSSCEFPPF